MSVFFDMFVPSRRHVEDERNRLEWTRDEEGEGDPHRGPIDLDSCVFSIKAEARDTGAAREATAATAVAETAAAARPGPEVTMPEQEGTPRSEP